MTTPDQSELDAAVRHEVVGLVASLHATRDEAADLARRVVGGDWRVVTMFASGEPAGYLPVIEGNLCPCCWRKIDELGGK